MFVGTPELSNSGNFVVEFSSDFIVRSQFWALWLVVVFCFCTALLFIFIKAKPCCPREKFTTSPCTHPACGVSLVCSRPLTTVLALEPPSAQRGGDGGCVGPAKTIASDDILDITR